MRIFEDTVYCDGELLSAILAFVEALAHPVALVLMNGVDPFLIHIPAVGAYWAIGPTEIFKVQTGCLFCRELRHDLHQGEISLNNSVHA